MSDDEERDDGGAPRRAGSSPVPAVGLILPGTVRIVKIAPFVAPDGQKRWRITLRGVLAAGDAPLVPDLGELDCTLSFTTADPSLIRQIRAQKLRYVLDLIQLQREGAEEGRVEDTVIDMQIEIGPEPEPEAE